MSFEKIAYTLVFVYVKNNFKHHLDTLPCTYTPIDPPHVRHCTQSPVKHTRKVTWLWTYIYTETPTETVSNKMDSSKLFIILKTTCLSLVIY